ncbi:unnamed protein product [Plutella xylostella]|uniref:(diamondback moth) hypothetical protein n=1 Tax=Plutella xylostella TaxID=51655 RepID=A0A8S4FWG8_PLUXY|nr:unnamed protein product [Plutella xylostella]
MVIVTGERKEKEEVLGGDVADPVCIQDREDIRRQRLLS